MKKIVNAFLLLFFAAFASVAMAGGIKPYSQVQFDTLAAAGKPVLVAVHATWCPTCKAQRVILDKLMKRPAYQDVTTLVIDFDSEKSLLRHYRVGMQSTLIAFKGTKEVGRSVGDTTEAGIETLIDKTVN